MDVALTLSFNILADETVVVQGWDHPMYEKIVPQDYAELIELVNSLDSDQILCAVIAFQLYESSDLDAARFYKSCKYNLKAYTKSRGQGKLFYSGRHASYCPDFSLLDNQLSSRYLSQGS